jgi:hypothetical protein
LCKGENSIPLPFFVLPQTIPFSPKYTIIFFDGENNIPGLIPDFLYFRFYFEIDFIFIFEIICDPHHYRTHLLCSQILSVIVPLKVILILCSTPYERFSNMLYLDITQIWDWFKYCSKFRLVTHFSFITECKSRFNSVCSKKIRALSEAMKARKKHLEFLYTLYIQIIQFGLCDRNIIHKLMCYGIEKRHSIRIEHFPFGPKYITRLCPHIYSCSPGRGWCVYFRTKVGRTSGKMACSWSLLHNPS